MLQPRRFGNLGVNAVVHLLFIFLIGNAVLGIPDNWHPDPGDGSNIDLEKLEVDRVKRDTSGVTTLLLVNNDEARHIKGSRPEGLLTSTARTFVHDGTTTEFGTQIIGTSLDHGRFYAQLLQTSSRVYFGDQERVPISKQKPDERISHKTRYFPLNLENYINPSVFYDVRPAETILVFPTRADDSLNLVKPVKVEESASLVQRVESSNNGVEILVKENSGNIFFDGQVKEKERQKQAFDGAIRLKQQGVASEGGLQVAREGGLVINPTKAIPNDLPTYTVRHDFAPSGFSWSVPESEKEEITVKVEKSKFRAGKGLHGKVPEKKLDTVTYLGFADFTTTVGDTVIVFMPNTRDGGTKSSAVEESVSVTSKSDNQEVMTTIKTFMSHSPGMVTQTIPGHSLSMQTSIPTQVADRQSKAYDDSLEIKSSFLSKEQGIFESPSVAISTSFDSIEPSETQTEIPVEKTSQEPTVPLSTFATTITKTFGKSGESDKPLGLLKSIGGTRAFNGTTTHFTSLLYGTFIGNTYTQVLKSTSKVFYLAEGSAGISATKVEKPLETVAPEIDMVTTEQPSEEEEEEEEEEEQLTTLTDTKTTKGIPETTPETEVEESSTAENDSNEDKVEATEEYVTRIVPSTVYKTFTYLTTFFIPAADGTTTSIRSREVVSSELSYVTKTVETNLRHTEINDYLNEIRPTESVFDNNVDPEFLPPPTRILAPEEPITTTTEEPEAEVETEKEDRETTVIEPKPTEPSTEAEVKVNTEATEEPSTAAIPVATTPTTTTTETVPVKDEEEDKSDVTEEEKEEEKESEESEEEEEDDEDEKDESEEDEVEKEEVKKDDVKKVEVPLRATQTASLSDDDEEEIEVIYKTIYTTYTYLTTFFQDQTTSISSREVVVTNVITSTIENAVTPTARELPIKPSQTEDVGIRPTASVRIQEEPDNEDFDIEPSTVFDSEEDEATETPELQINGVKTFYTTYTYFTTLFDKGSTSIKSRINVVTNVVNPTVSALPASILQNEELLKSKFEMLLREQQNLKSTRPGSVIHTTPNSARGSSEYGRSSINPSSAIRGRFGTLVRKARPFFSNVSSDTTTLLSSANELDNGVGKFVLKGDKFDRTIVRKRIRTKSRLLPKSTTIDEGVTTIRLDPTPIEEDDRIILQTMITDVTKTTSGGNRQVKRIAPPEPIERPILLDDQVSSESNNEEIEPSPTLLLQTSFTTFTYFTTVYKGSTSDVISRLETVTNVVTETLKPDVLITPALSPEDATLPITYFTTFTYWTTLYRDGSTVITSREETVSNIVTPAVEATITDSVIKPEIIATSVVQSAEITTQSPAVQTVFVPAFVPAAIPETTTEKKEETTTPIDVKPIELVTEGLINKVGIEEEKPEPTTFYTTYTYFTTSYIGDSTVVKSRLETVTNIITATPTISEITANDIQTGRAVNSASANQIPDGDQKPVIDPAVSDLQTGLLSTIVSTSVNDGVTTLYSTDIYGTFIDGLYAKILESTTKIATEVEVTPSSTVTEQKTGIVSLNEGRIVDADGISTTFFTTKAIGTSIESLYAQVVESTSSVVVDEDKKSALALLNGEEENNDIFRTGLVRLIEGSIIKDGTITLYESRVIGTVIDGRYAQIIESTSSFKIEPSIAPSVVIQTQVTPTLEPSPSPPTLESSIVDESGEEEEEGEEGYEDEEGYDGNNKGRVKSRLTFQSRKRTFTPVIRPFASRNRPTFLPKKKTIGASSAQTITRAFTPTVTATLATKGDGGFGASRNRFGSGRRSSTAEVRPTVSSSGGKRFSGRGRTSVSSALITPTYSPSRGRQSTVRVSATPTLNLSSSRGRNFRVSSSRPGLNSDNAAFRSNLSLRPRIRPTLSGLPGVRATTAPPPIQDEINDFTTVVTEDDLGVTIDEESSSTTSTTTEDPNLARRNNNPLLRFRRPPLVPKATTSTTPRTTTTQAPRRGILANRNNRPSAVSFTTPRSTRTRPANSFANRSQLQNRPRPVNSLFPPRGLFKKQFPQDEEKSEEEIEDEEDEFEDEEDNNFEESAAKEVEAEAEERSSEVPRGRSLPPVQIRPFRFQRQRAKRQTHEFGSRHRTTGETKYRRKSRPQVQERADYVDEEATEAAPKVTSRNGKTYTARPRATTQAPSVPSPPRIRPSLASAQKSQFTLRDKETANPRTTNFRRNQATTPRRKSTIQKPTESTLQRKSSRARTSQSTQEYSRTPQRRNYNNNRRTSTSTRGRGRFGEGEDTYTYSQPAFDGTITVTHKIPSEVSIPFVNGKNTEYRAVITAKPSLEVVGPHQYLISTVNGNSVIFLSREVTETLNNGITEVTRFLIHETPTTSVTFTPTTIRGRKTSFSHIVPSTVYDVENIVTTLQPQISANAPLANILLSQLLLGNLNLPPNQALGLNPANLPTAPSTEYKTRTTTYVTSVTDQTSTVLPITFRGKEILTTIVDSSVNVITATEYITETIVVTPTLNPNNQINSLLLPALLQAQLLQPNTPQIQTPPLAPLAQNPFQTGLTLDHLNFEALQQPQPLQEEPKFAKNDIRGERESEIVEEEKPEVSPREKPRKKSQRKEQQEQPVFRPEPAKEVITLYVSGRRPGEFSTILSTVYSSDVPAVVRKRETVLDDIERLLVEASEVKQVKVLASVLPELEESSSPSYLDYLVTPGVTPPVDGNEFNFETQSLESVLGDVSKHLVRSPSVRENVEPTLKVTEQ